MTRPRSVTALILAGRRRNDADADAWPSVAHKAFLEVAGQPLIAHVLRAVAGCQAVGDILIAAPDDLHEDFSRFAPPGGDVRLITAADSPAATIGAALGQAPEGAMLTTTSDHPLLTTEMIDLFLAACQGADNDGAKGEGSDSKADDCETGACDAAAACVARDDYLAAYPDIRRTFVQFRDFAFSGANLFWFRVGGAEKLVDFWRRLERDRKSPLKMAATIGYLTGALYLAGRLTKARALKTLAAKTGARARLVALPFPQAAIDVDKPEDLEIVRKIFSGLGDQA